MWIGILFIVVGGLYLLWCLARGKIFVTLGTDLRKNTKLIDRKDKPGTFWLSWVISTIALTVFAIYLVRTALN